MDHKIIDHPSRRLALRVKELEAEVQSAALDVSVLRDLIFRLLNIFAETEKRAELDEPKEPQPVKTRLRKKRPE
jgi:hypothetical protein